MYQRVRIPGVGEWSQPVEKALREGEEIVPGDPTPFPLPDAPEQPQSPQQSRPARRRHDTKE